MIPVLSAITQAPLYGTFDAQPVIIQSLFMFCRVCFIYSTIFILLTVGTIFTHNANQSARFCYQYKLKFFPPTSQFRLIEAKSLLEWICTLSIGRMV